MTRPFITVVSFYGLGLLLAQLLQPPLAVLFGLSFFLLLLVFVIAKLRVILLCALLVLAGWTNLVFHTAIISPNDLRRLIGTSNETEPATVRGQLLQTPQIKISERRGYEFEHSLTQVRVSEIRMGDDWRPAVGDIIVTAPGLPGTNFFAGQSVELSGVIGRPAPAEAEGLFDYRAYLQRRGIYYELKTSSTNDWELRGPILPRPPVTDRFLKWSRHVLGLGLPEDETLRLLWAMTLGWRTAFTGDVSDPFLRAGTMHMFAIDGLRIALISGMLVALLRVLQVSRGWCGIVAIPAIWFYTAATGWESSAIRASLMMSIVIGGWALKRPSDLLNSLAGAAFLILLWDPCQLFEASFQLSFCVMLTIALLLPRLNDFFDDLLKTDPLLPASLVPRWRRVVTDVLRVFGRYFSLSLAAWVGSIPLSAYYFHLFSLISPLANLFAVPLGTFALMANLGALLCGTWFPFVTGLFNNAAWFLMLEMGSVSEWSTRIPGSFIYVRAPSWIWVVIYYAVMVGLLSGWMTTMRRKISGFASAVLIGAIYLVCQFQWRSETDLTVLPLEGGHAIYVDGGANDCLIDCGSEDSVHFTVRPFLEAHGVNGISHLVLTEGDSKNCGGAETLDDYFAVRELWTSEANFRSPVYRKAVASFEQPADRRKILHCGDTVGCWQVLWPSADSDFKRADDNALVLQGNFYGRKVLLLSDLSSVGQKGLLSGTNDLHADIVIAGLPNEGEPLSDALLDAVQPKLIVVADSAFPTRRRANSTLRERLEQRNVPVVYTSDSGAVKVVLNKTGFTWNASAEIRAEGATP